MTKEAEKWKALADAFFRFVQKNPPKGFNPYGMIMLAQAGRIDELIKILDGFQAAPSACDESRNSL